MDAFKLIESEEDYKAGIGKSDLKILSQNISLHRSKRLKR